MFHKVLIANRGEIAIRIIRACRELGVKTVAVYSEADRDALHVRYANEAFYIGPAPSTQSYLHIPHIISAAVAAGADAIHPGYGFLAENPFFASVCETWGIRFIGPSALAIEKMGIKVDARTEMQKAGVPVVPGSEGIVTSKDELLAIANDIGYPVLVKASAGGGGRGIRIAHNADELVAAWEKAQSEAKATFGSAEVYVEKYLESAHHIEFQILGDSKGNVIHLGERDCSLQRRRQKILEEGPSAILDPDLRARMAEAAVSAAKAVDYNSAGTVEFLVDGYGNFYFIEMNTRIQVEHPVTEWITGVDLVKEQIRVAAGQPLRYTQDDIKLRGWAIECRINAEDPDKGLMPSVGQITAYEPPTGPWTRVDSAVYQGLHVQPYYDSMIAKVIVWAETRPEA
ncbi:MAG: acetyl-CoA carboxylase biotin carboxylase subunit, partial [Actinobacteria bacterium]|nr:acetyl-CoA carboxylase biotin carboxylase subunit [Actinomycetota bacterium]